MKDVFIEKIKEKYKDEPEIYRDWIEGIRKISCIGGKNDGNIFYATSEKNGSLSFIDWEFNLHIFSPEEENIKFKFLDTQ